MKWLILIHKYAPTICKLLRWISGFKPSRALALIVEDDPDDAESLEAKLHARGYNCEIATSAEAAQGMVKHTFYPLIIVDLRLPTMSGAALVRVLSEDSPNAKIVIVCGDPSHLADIYKRRVGHVIKYDETPFICYIPKPASTAAIDKMIRDLHL